jgi:hypothetical protein
MNSEESKRADPHHRLKKRKSASCERILSPKQKRETEPYPTCPNVRV